MEREDLPEKYKTKTTIMQRANNYFFKDDIQKSKLTVSQNFMEQDVNESPDQLPKVEQSKAGIRPKKQSDELQGHDFEFQMAHGENSNKIEAALTKKG